MAIIKSVSRNTFDILIGLGLPWALGSARVPLNLYYNGGADNSDYDRDRVIIELTLHIIAASLLAFIVLVLFPPCSSFVLSRCQGYILVGLYVAYIAYVCLEYR